MASLNSTTVVRQSERTASRVVDGRAIVIVIDRSKLHTLNAVGSRIWEMSEEPGRPIGRIVSAICEEFAVEQEAAEVDTAAFVERMLGCGALEVVKEGA